jgi:putative photosynthetic complex assembly protein
MAQAQTAPGGDKIPAGLVRMMAALALATLGIVTFAVVSERPRVGVPHAAPVVQERRMVLLEGQHNAVTALDEEGRQIVALDNGGFISVVLNGLNHERRKQGAAMDSVVTLTRYANGRLTLSDSATGWSAELQAFGAGNMAAFERLLAD